MHGSNRFDRLDLNNDLAFYNQVGAEPYFHVDVFPNHRDCLLAYNLQASSSQFMRHHRFVNAFKKPRAQGCVYAVCGIDDLRSNLILGHAETDSNKRFHAKAQRGKGAKEKTKPYVTLPFAKTVASACPVNDFVERATSSGVPSATMRPPASPPSGPRSMIQSACFTTSRLCSMMMMVLPRSVKRLSSWRSCLTSSKCRPVVGSSRM